MKKIQIKKFFAGAAAIITVFANVALLAVPSTAQAACSYTINFDVDKRNATPESSLYLTAESRRSGTGCRDTVHFQFIARDKVWGSLEEKGLYRSKQGLLNAEYALSSSFFYDSKLNAEVARATFTYDLKNLDFSNLTNPNSLPVFARVIGYNSIGSNDVLRQSGDINITISGSSGSTTQPGVSNITLNFDRTAYSPGDTVQLRMGISPIKNLPNAVLIKTYVGAREVGSFEKANTALSTVQTTTQTQTIPVAEGGYFNNGLNDVRVTVVNKNNTAVKYAEGTGKVFVEGLKVSASGGAGAGAGAGAGSGAGAGAGTGAGTGAGAGAGSAAASPKLDEKLFNPLPTDSLTGTVLTVAKGFLAIVALWAVTFIIIGAFKLTMAQGNEEAYIAAKKTIIWAVLGMVVAMLSFSIIAIVQSVLQISVPPVPTNNSSKEGDQPVKNLNN